MAHKIVQGLKEAVAHAKLENMNIEAAHFRDICDRLLHALPITNDTPEGVRAILGKLSSLTYKHGKQGVIDARAMLAKLETDYRQ